VEKEVGALSGAEFTELKQKLEFVLGIRTKEELLKYDYLVDELEERFNIRIHWVVSGPAIKLANNLYLRCSLGDYYLFRLNNGKIEHIIDLPKFVTRAIISDDSEKYEWKGVLRVHATPNRMFYIVSAKKGQAKIRIFNKEEGEWDEQVLVTPSFSGSIALKDISSDGKHFCRLYHIYFGQIKQEIFPPSLFLYWRDGCPVCPEITKAGKREIWEGD